MDSIIRKRSQWALIAGIVLAVIYYPIMGYLTLAGRGYTLTILFISRLLIWSEVLVLYLYSLKVENQPFLLWPDKPRGFWFYPLWAVGLYLLVIGAGFIARFPSFSGYREHGKLMYTILKLVSQNQALLWFSAITAGITEELIFRAYLVPRLVVLFKNNYLPVFLSALIFAAMHLRYNSLHEFLFTFLFGVLFAVHYQKYRNIKVLIIVHAFTDLVTFLLFAGSFNHHHPVK